jgi:hypothetical protein
MATDFIPRRAAEQLTWLKNLRATLEEAAAVVGWTSAQCKQVQGQIDALIQSHYQRTQAEATLRSVVAGHNALSAQVLGELRGVLRQLKADPRLDAGTQVRMRAVSRAQQALTPYSVPAPEVRIQVAPGRVRLQWKKRRMSGVRVYGRLAGQTQWQFLGVDTKSPYDDRRPLASPGVPELREYRLRYLKDDDEIGPFSNLLTVTFAG